MKACPFCGDKIQDKAVKCRFCGKFLDSNQKGNEEANSESITSIDLKVVSGGKRFINLISDVLFGYIFVYVCGFLLGFFFSGFVNGMSENDPFWTLIGYIFFGSYYLIFESIFGKTPGKWITKSKVVTLSGKRPMFVNILGRTLCRFIPFDALSFLGKNAIGWHDTLSATRVVDDLKSIDT